MSKRRIVRGSFAATAVISLILAAIGVISPTTFASSHREAPLILGDPLADNTDVYAFTSPDKPDTVTLVSNWTGFQEPAGGPNFYPFGEDLYYDINVTNDGGATPNITYRWIFTSNYKDPTVQFLYNTGPVESLDDPDLNFTQTYELQAITNGQVTTLASGVPVAPSNVGEASMPNYGDLRSQAVRSLDNGITTFAGQAHDSFFADLRVFDLLYGGDLSEVGDNTFAPYNINTIAIQVPKSLLAGGGDPSANPIIGVYSTTSRPSMRVQAADGTETASGDYVQVSRLGNPLVNEVVVPYGVKDAFNASQPSGDAQFLPTVQDPILPQLIEKIYNIPAPAPPREDLVSVFLTGVEGLNQPANVSPSEQLRLNMSTPVASNPDRLGVIGGDMQGFPNGRRLADDVIDIELQVVQGELVGAENDLTDGVDATNIPFGDTFPYVALPIPGSVGDRGTSLPNGGVKAGLGGTATSSGDFPVLPVTLTVFGLALVGLAVTRGTRRTARGQG